MRGYVEESEEVIAKRALRQAARKLAAAELTFTIGHEVNVAEAGLHAAALAYVAAAYPPKRRKARLTKGVGQ